MPSLANITVKPDLFPEGKQKQWAWERKGVKGDGREEMEEVEGGEAEVGMCCMREE